MIKDMPLRLANLDKYDFSTIMRYKGCWDPSVKDDDLSFALIKFWRNDKACIKCCISAVADTDKWLFDWIDKKNAE